MSTIPQSTTPRTDAAVRLTIGAGFNMVYPSFARELENELAAERARHNALRQAVFDVLCDPEGRACFHGSDADRAAIDKAMKEGIK